MNTYTHTCKNGTYVSECATHVQLQSNRCYYVFSSFTRYARIDDDNMYYVCYGMEGVSKKLMDERARARKIVLCTKNNCQINSYCVVILNGVRKKQQPNVVSTHNVVEIILFSCQYRLRLNNDSEFFFLFLAFMCDVYQQIIIKLKLNKSFSTLKINTFFLFASCTQYHVALYVC